MAREEHAPSTHSSDQDCGIMRITAGTYRGRKLARPSDRKVRVTTERVREALFNIHAEKIPGARVLDLFAGSGVVGLEALSRGAATVDFVEVSRASLSAIRANVRALDLSDQTRVHRGDAMRFVERLPEGTYDVVLADPPFSTEHAQKLVELFRRCAFAKFLSIEHRSTLTLTGDETRRYGDVALTFCFAP